MVQFKKAEKKQSKLRAAFFGPAGSGKTFTALRVATGMGGPVAVIDSERGSASKYADRFNFDVLDLEQRSIADYVEAVKAAAVGKYPVLVIDSMSHAWQELLEEVDRLAKQKFRGNTWSAWSEGTPKQRKFIDVLADYPGHVIVTMRTKTEWTIAEDDKGKRTPTRVGLAPEQGKGIEYEFDLLLELSTEHVATVIKDRTGKYQDRIIEKPGEEFGGALVAWLMEGKPVEAPAAKPEGVTGPQIKAIKTLLALKGADGEAIKRQYGVASAKDLTQAQASEIIDTLHVLPDVEKQPNQPAEPSPAAAPIDITVTAEDIAAVDQEQANAGPETTPEAPESGESPEPVAAAQLEPTAGQQETPGEVVALLSTIEDMVQRGAFTWEAVESFCAAQYQGATTADLTAAQLRQSIKYLTARREANGEQQEKSQRQQYGRGWRARKGNDGQA